MAKIIQPNANPTRKLTAAIVAAAAVEILKVVVRVYWPQFDEPSLWSALTPLAVAVAGWFIKDDANVEVTIK